MNKKQKKLLVNNLWTAQGDSTHLCSTCIKKRLKISNKLYCRLRKSVSERDDDSILTGLHHKNKGKQPGIEKEPWIEERILKNLFPQLIAKMHATLVAPGIM